VHSQTALRRRVSQEAADTFSLRSVLVLKKLIQPVKHVNRRTAFPEEKKSRF
jgi:hypothetical protein